MADYRGVPTTQSFLDDVVEAYKDGVSLGGGDAPTISDEEILTLLSETGISNTQGALEVGQEAGEQQVRDAAAIEAQAVMDKRAAARVAYDAKVNTPPEPADPPVVSSLNPVTATIGDPSFTLHVIGTGFTSASAIVFNGFAEPTTFVSETELTTGVDMSVWLGPSEPLPVTVINADGQTAAPVTFTFVAPAPEP